MMESNHVILVDEKDQVMGTMEKMDAHRVGLLHRAFSVFVFDKEGRMLLQQRALSKYHGGHVWTNTCCSHPYPGERTEEAALRRLQEEMGFTAPIQEIFSFTYKARVENGLIEHEFDHVFAGAFEGIIKPDDREVASWRYDEMDKNRRDIQAHPQIFTEWFKIAFPRIEQWWEEAYPSKSNLLGSRSTG